MTLKALTAAAVLVLAACSEQSVGGAMDAGVKQWCDQYGEALIKVVKDHPQEKHLFVFDLPKGSLSAEDKRAQITLSCLRPLTDAGFRVHTPPPAKKDDTVELQINRYDNQAK